MEEEQLQQRLLVDDDLFEELEVTENELVDQYVHHHLSDEDRDLFEKYLLQTPQQHRKVTFATVLHEATAAHALAKQKITPFKSPWEKGPQFSPAFLRIAAVLIVTFGLATAVWILFRRQSDVSRGMLALNQAYRNERLVEPRISEMNYSPLLNTRSGTPPKIDNAARTQAELFLTSAASRSSGAVAHHALGRFYLAEKQFELARQRFERALQLDPGNAQLYSDLSATFLELGKSQRSRDEAKAAQSFQQSLQCLNRALELDNSSPEALFNRGLLLEELSLWSKAEDAWQRYLQKDSTSQWAAEARAHLASTKEENKSTQQSDR